MHLPTRALLAVVLFVLSLSTAPSGHGQPRPQPRQWELEIPAQPITLALKAFSVQTTLQHGYLPTNDAEEQILSSALQGKYTAEEALRRLLPTGFTYEWIDERTVGIIPPPTPAPPKLYVDDNTLDEDSVTSAFERGRKKFQGIFVVASRIGSLNPPQMPTAVLDREDLDALGVSTAAEVLEYLPQQPFSRSAGFRASGEQYADLRGLGPDTTLILINGRRVNASATSFDTNAFDLNTIPLAAVNRVEILLDSMAVSAGADAIGGVINFILKDHFSGPLLEARYGIARGGAEELRLSAGGEHSGDALRLSAVLDYFKRQDLPGTERDLWHDQDYRRFGGADLRSSDSNPGNVTSPTLDNLPGLSARYAAVPHHESDTVLTPADFLATAGQRNLESLYQYRSIVPETDRVSAVGSARLNISQYTAAFGELLYTDRTSILHDLPVTLSNIRVPPTNPFNPFGVPVLASFRLSGLGEHLQATEARFTRALLGLRHEGIRWTAEISVQAAEDAAQVTTRNGIDALRVAQALAQPDRTLALNVFDDGPGASDDVLRTLVASPVSREYVSRETQVSAVLRARFFDAPAGAVSTILGAEWRKPQVEVAALTQGNAQRTIASGFAELHVPLVNRQMRFPATEELSLTLSARADEFNDIADAWNTRIALAWSPLASLLLRASYGSSFRAPSLYELYQPAISFPFALPDPRRNNEVAAVTVTVGGNPELEQATARSWSFGLMLQRAELASLELSTSWWKVAVDNRVAPITVPALFAQEDLFADRVLRATASDADVAAGLPGRLSGLDLTPSNLGHLSADGVDAAVTFRVESAVGLFTPSVSATWMNHFETADLRQVRAKERVGVASIFGTIPKWRAVVRLGWGQGALGASTAVRFVSRYDDFNLIQQRATGRVIRSQALVDLQASVDGDLLSEADTLWRGLRLTAGINNILDDGPQFAEVGGNAGYDVTQGDLRQRFGYLRFTKRF